PLSRNRHGVFLLPVAGRTVRRRTGGLQRRTDPPTRRPGQLAALRHIRGILEPHHTELAVRISRGRLHGCLRDLPAATRIARIQTGRRSTRRNPPGQLTPLVYALRRAAAPGAGRSHSPVPRPRAASYAGPATP